MFMVVRNPWIWWIEKTNTLYWGEVRSKMLCQIFQEGPKDDEINSHPRRGNFRLALFHQPIIKPNARIWFWFRKGRWPFLKWNKTWKYRSPKQYRKENTSPAKPAFIWYPLCGPPRNFPELGKVVRRPWQVQYINYTR